MTNYVKENEFRSCELNYLSNPTPFIVDAKGQITPNPNYNIESSIFKRLAIDDTFHDLSKERNGYDKGAFNNNGPANYLLTGKFIQGDNISYFKNSINYDEFIIPGGSFESNVTKSIEIKRGLQTADISITYDDILSEFGLPTPQFIGDKLKQKLILSGGSLRLCLDLNNPFIKKLKKTSITFSEYMIAISKNEEDLKKNHLKIATFVRWFLHSDDIENLQLMKAFNLPSVSMKILSDAGISFLGDFFGVENSLVTPFIAVPCFLDSASTSMSVLDPNIPIYFEKLDSNIVIPIISNYFSCDEYFIGYLLNENSTFDKDNLYSFSLILFKIPETPNVIEAISFIRNNPSIFGENISNYNSACNFIKTYIDENPQSVARYFFGEVQKQGGNQNSDVNDNLKCGTCGAGVPYIGKIMDLLLKNIPNTAISGQWLSANGNVFNLKQIFNTLKNSGPLNSRIPIADSRILKLFCYNTSLPNGTTVPFMNMTQDNYLSLFKILADYKRTGDYQQSYTVLKEILKNGSNAECFTFCSGDELSTLIGRLLGVPSIYQVGVTSTCTLYRCNLLNASPSEKAILEIRNDKKIIENYLNKISYKLLKTSFFIKNNYANICQLREDLNTFYQQLQQSLQTNSTDVFIFIKVSNAVYVLSKLIKECNVVLDFTTNNEFVQSVKKLYETNTQLDQLLSTIQSTQLQQVLDNTKSKMHQFLLEISKFEEGNRFSLFNTINDSGNLMLSLDTIVSYFNPLNYEEKKLTFKRDIFGLNIKNGKDIVTKTRKMVEFIKKRFSPPISSRGSTRGLEEKIRAEKIENNLFVSEYNDLIDSFNTSIFENGLEDDIKLINFESFNPDYLTKLVQLVNGVVNTELQNTRCDAETYSQIDSNLSAILTSLGIQQPIQPAGNSNYISGQYGGGSVQDFNRRIICNDIQKLLLNLTNKCARYSSNTLESCISQGNSFTDCIKYVSDNYETDDFCYQILFEQDDDYSLESEKLGFVIGLKILAEQYTYSDLLEPTQLPYPDYIDKVLNVNDMLDILQIPYVKLILVLLTWSNVKNVELLFDLIEYNTTAIDNSCKDNFIQQCFENYIQKNYREYDNIYKFLISNEKLNTSLSIFSIVGLGFLNYSYYGKNSQCFYPQLCEQFLKIVPDTRGLIYLSLPPMRFLQESLLLLNTIYTQITHTLGQSAYETGPGLAKGVRQVNPPQRYGYGYGYGGFKKFKTIKHKKFKNIKRTRNNKKKYNKSIKVIKINKKRKTRRRHFK
jgi:hypothetical protein